jgi:hypothetical protein
VIARANGLSVERDPRRRSGRLLVQHGMEASYVDLADPTHLEFDYMRWLRLALRAARAERILHIGGGACALPRALASEWPAGRQEVCEVDVAVLALAREHLGLRRTPGLHVRVAEGRDFLTRQDADSWHAIVLDAFVGASVPPRLITAEALAEVARVAPYVLVNVVDDRTAKQTRTVAAGLRLSFPAAWAIGGRGGNTVVAGAQRAPDLERLSAALAADHSPARLVAPAALARLSAGTPPLEDAELTAPDGEPELTRR